MWQDEADIAHRTPDLTQEHIDTCAAAAERGAARCQRGAGTAGYAGRYVSHWITIAGQDPAEEEQKRQEAHAAKVIKPDRLHGSHEYPLFSFENTEPCVSPVPLFLHTCGLSAETEAKLQTVIATAL